MLENLLPINLIKIVTNVTEFKYGSEKMENSLELSSKTNSLSHSDIGF